MINGHAYDGPDAAKTYSGRPRTWGFRLSLVDCVVICMTVVAMGLLWRPTDGFSVIGGLVVGHFFLFCNVFRIPRKPELIWSGTFLLICVFAMLFDAFTPISVCACVAAVTLLVLIYSIRLPTYHGIFANRLNQRLGDYLTGRTEQD
ncbi:MAG: hypothetical protein AAGG48_28760 [Planctomycetota bacterium]